MPADAQSQRNKTGQCCRVAGFNQNVCCGLNCGLDTQELNNVHVLYCIIYCLGDASVFIATLVLKTVFFSLICLTACPHLNKIAEARWMFRATDIGTVNAIKT